jgi:hypothetical protein
MKPMLEAPDIQRLKLEYDNLLSSFAFTFKLRRYIWVELREYQLQSLKRMLALEAAPGGLRHCMWRPIPALPGTWQGAAA